MKPRSSKVLIVDDDPEVADTLTYIITQQGYDVSVAYDGEWALTLAKRQKFDFAFMDILLPGMNGVECYSRFKTLCPDASVFMMTGYASEDLAKRALVLGANDVLRKPVMPEEMLAKLERSGRDALLIVDDDEDVCNSLRSMMKKAGWKCEVAHDGETAIRIASQQAFSTMILDLKLPDTPGVEVFARLSSAGINIPTLVVTGHDAEYDRVDHPNIRGYLMKPADPRVIFAMVDRSHLADA